MKSLFQDADSSEIIARINAVSADDVAQWGKMDAARMFAHCQIPFRIATGEVELKRNLIGRLLGGWAKKKFVISDAPFKPNGPTDPRFVVKDARDFGKEQARLVALVESFASGGPDGVTRKDHPFFGAMSPAEWDKLMWKHLDHHLRQFGQ